MNEIVKSVIKSGSQLKSPNNLLKLRKMRMPNPPKIKTELNEVPKLKPKINKAPEVRTPMPKMLSVQKLAKEARLLYKIAKKMKEAQDIPGTPSWIKKLTSGD